VSTRQENPRSLVHVQGLQEKPETLQVVSIGAESSLIPSGQESYHESGWLIATLHRSGSDRDKFQIHSIIV
jgi:hypothetical protein